MYSPVLSSWPTTSGSPPVRSISWSDRSFSVLASSLAWTLAHSRPLCRFMFFSKRVFNVLSSSSRCCVFMSFPLYLVSTRLLQKRSLGEAQACSPGATRHRRGDPGSGGPHLFPSPGGATATPCPAEPAVAPPGL